MSGTAHVVCGTCGTENTAGRAFCNTCGEPLPAQTDTEDAPRAAKPARRGLSRSSKRIVARIVALVVVAAAVTVIVGALLELREDGGSPLASRATPGTESTTVETEGEGQDGAGRARQFPASAITADASSSLEPVPERGLTYGPENTLDGDLETAWNDGTVGSGVGERLLFTFPETIEVVRLEIVNGYAKSPQLFSENARVRAARIITDESTTEVELADVIERQTIEGPFGTTSSVIIEILSVYPGTAYEDLAITEIVFWARPSTGQGD